VQGLKTQSVMSAEVTDRSTQFSPSEGAIDRVVAFGEHGFGEM
jgi:hypothetical protein